MNKFFQSLGSGRSFALLATLGAALLCIYIFFADPPFGTFFGALGILLLFVSLVSLILARKIEIGEDRASLRKINQRCIENQEKLNTVKSEVDSLNKSLDTLQKEISECSLSSVDVDSQEIGEGIISVFSPQYIQPTEIKSRPSAQSAGRLAAEQIMANGGEKKLHFLLNSTPQNRIRKIQALGPMELINKLESIGEVEEISLGQALPTSFSEISYLVIDEKANRNGLWSGFLNAQKTSLFSSLLDLLKDYKRRGIVIITLTDSIPDHFSSTLRQHSHIVISENGSTFKWESDTHLPVVKALNEFHGRESIQ